MSRWRNLLLLLLVLVCAVSLYWGRDGGLPLPGWLSRLAAPHVAAPADVAAIGELPPVHLAILNGSGEAGLARRIALALAARGCVPERVDNAPHQDFARSLLINRRLDRDAAERLAAALGGLPLLTEWDGRTTEDAVLVLGADHGTVLAGIAPAP